MDTYASVKEKELRVQRVRTRVYNVCTLGQARAHGPCLYIFDTQNYADRAYSYLQSISSGTPR